MDASDDADVVDWSCCRCVAVDDGMDVDVEVVGPDVAVVDFGRSVLLCSGGGRDLRNPNIVCCIDLTLVRVYKEVQTWGARSL